MNSLLLFTNCLSRNQNQIQRLLNGKNKLIANQIQSRGMKKWQESTLKVMYHRSRLFDAVERPPDHRSTRQEWNFRAELFAFNQRLNEKFTENNLKIAFTHKSYIDKEMKQREELGLSDVSLNIEDNQRLSQNGEEICLTYIKSYLRHFLPRLPEEGIRAIYDYLMSEEVLSEVSKWIGCIDLILCQDFPPQPSTLAKTVKALIGALEEDHSLERAQNFILDFIITYLADKDILEIWDIPNPRFNLKSILNRERLPAHEYRLLSESGVGTIEACFVVGIYSNKELIGWAPGETIEIAKQMADLDALRRLFNLTPSKVFFKFGPNAYGIDLSQSNKETLNLNEWTTSLLPNYKIQTKQSL